MAWNDKQASDVTDFQVACLLLSTKTYKPRSTVGEWLEVVRFSKEVVGSTYTITVCEGYIRIDAPSE